MAKSNKVKNGLQKIRGRVKAIPYFNDAKDCVSRKDYPAAIEQYRQALELSKVDRDQYNIRSELGRLFNIKSSGADGTKLEDLEAAIHSYEQTFLYASTLQEEQKSHYNLVLLYQKAYQERQQLGHEGGDEYLAKAIEHYEALERGDFAGGQYLFTKDMLIADFCRARDKQNDLSQPVEGFGHTQEKDNCRDVLNLFALEYLSSGDMENALECMGFALDYMDGKDRKDYIFTVENTFGVKLASTEDGHHCFTPAV